MRTGKLPLILITVMATPYLTVQFLAGQTTTTDLLIAVINLVAMLDKDGDSS